jgi:cobalt/nickel transport system permease protein
MVPVWAVAAQRTRRALKSRQVPLLAALSAFSFTVMLFNVPVFGGTTAHAVGGTLLAIALGPWVAVIGVTVALAIQALLFADGGVLAFGANCLAMAFVGPFLGYAVYRTLSAGTPADALRRRTFAAAAGAYVGLNSAALTVALLLGLQPHLAQGPDGKPLYFPLDLSATLPGMLLPHLLVAGFVEAAVTAAGYAYLAGRKGAAIAVPGLAEAPPSRLYWVLVAAIVLAPLGLLAPGTAWGEWATQDVAKLVGYVPQGLARFGGLWRTPLADYSVGGESSTFLRSALGYYLCAVLGVGVILALMALLGRALTARAAATATEETA